MPAPMAPASMATATTPTTSRINQRWASTAMTMPTTATASNEMAGIGEPSGRFSVGTSAYFKMLTARAMTSATVESEMADCDIMVSLAHLDNGRTSVGLKAVALV